MTDQDIERIRQDVPDQPTRLPNGYLACMSCGCAVSYPADEAEIIRMESYGREGQIAGQNRRSTEIIFARCSACARREAIAARIVASYRGLSRRFGTESAIHRLSCALDALSVLGLGTTPIKNPHPTELSEAEALALIRHLCVPGATARWSSRFAPILAADASTGTCSPAPWSHVRMGQRQQLRTGYALVLRERASRSAPAAKIPLPALDKDDISPHNEVAIAAGCLFCGCAVQVLPATQIEQLGGLSSASRQVWALRKIPPQSMGGKNSPETLVGHVCRVCEASISHVGTVGPSSLERALTAHIAPDLLGKLGYGSLRLEGLIGWGVVAYENAETLPNEKPWEHLPDLAELPGKLRSALGG